MSDTQPDATSSAPRPWYRRIGPSLITACVVIGPGSIMTSSNVGAKYGYSLSWVIVLSVIFMLAFMSMGARLGVSSSKSAGQLLTERIGRWFAVLLGLSVFFISAAYQFGNNLGVHFALVTFLDWNYLIVIFNALTILFLIGSHHLYQTLEKLMMTLVGIMLTSFAINLIVSGPRVGEFLSGFVPSGFDQIDMTVLGLIGTTFVTSAAFYQTYLVRQKGWTKEQVKDGLIDTRVGACVMAAITLMLMSTPATLFHEDFQHEQVVSDPQDSAFEKGALVIDDSDPELFASLKKKAEAEVDWKTDAKRWSAVIGKSEVEAASKSLEAKKKTPPELSARGFSQIPEVGMSLEPLFGGKIGPTLFFLGVFAAAYSSFLVNSMIGGFILADGLGLGSSPTDRWPKIFTIAVLLTGMGVGLYCILYLGNQSPIGLIVAAQAVTVLAAPLVGGTLLWLSSRRDIMGENVNRPLVTVIGILGFVMLLAMSAKLALVDIPTKLDSLLGR